MLPLLLSLYFSNSCLALEHFHLVRIAHMFYGLLRSLCFWDYHREGGGRGRTPSRRGVGTRRETRVFLNPSIYLILQFRLYHLALIKISMWWMLHLNCILPHWFDNRLYISPGSHYHHSYTGLLSSIPY